MFDLSKALNKPEVKPEAKSETKMNPLENESTIKPITGDISLLDSLPANTLSYKEQLANVPSLDELAEEFQNPDQPELFSDKALSAIHQACQTLEESIDNADEVKSQLTFIMTELRKYPDVAAKVCDSDISTMVKALRHSYNIVAFAKQTNRKPKLRNRLRSMT